MTEYNIVKVSLQQQTSVCTERNAVHGIISKELIDQLIERSINMEGSTDSDKLITQSINHSIFITMHNVMNI